MRRDHESSILNSLNGQNPRCELCGAERHTIEYKLFGKARTITMHCACMDEAREREREAEKAMQVAEMLRLRGFETGIYAKMTLQAWKPVSEFIENKIWDYVNSVKETSPNWLVLYGGVGNGKTHLAVAAARQLAYDRQWDAAVLEWADYTDRLMRSWKQPTADPEINGAYDTARRCRVLVLDDIDKTPVNEHTAAQLYNVLNHRYVRQLPTIITENRSPSELMAAWGSKLPETGAAIISRIVGAAMTAVKFDLNDFRLRQYDPGNKKMPHVRR